MTLELDGLQTMAEAAAKEQPTTEAETLIHGASVTILALIERVRQLEYATKRAGGELRHAYGESVIDRGLVARAVSMLEAVTTPKGGA